MQMPGRTYVSNNTQDYKFGFNGKLKDNEIAGTGNSYDYGLRMYDSRIARFKSVDPLGAKFPWLSSYQFAGNTPIAAVDIDGGESRVIISENVTNKDGTSAIHLRSVQDIIPHGPLGMGILDARYTMTNGSLSQASFYYEGKTAEYSSFNQTEDGRTTFEKWSEKTLAPILYDYVSNNPLQKAAGNSMSAAIGRDLTIPSLADAQNGAVGSPGKLVEMELEVCVGL